MTILLAIIAAFVMVQPVTSAFQAFGSIATAADKVSVDLHQWRMDGCPKRFISDHQIHFTCDKPEAKISVTKTAKVDK